MPDGNGYYVYNEGKTQPLPASWHRSKDKRSASRSSHSASISRSTFL